MLPMPSEVIKQVGVFTKNQPRDIVFADRAGRNTIGDLPTDKDNDQNVMVTRNTTVTKDLLGVKMRIPYISMMTLGRGIKK